MPIDKEVSSAIILELDDRAQIKARERVWLPNKDESALGYTNVGGVVDEAQEGYIAIILDRPLRLVSQSGSPVISQVTGKVIGLVSRGGTLDDGKTALVLTPVSEIRRVITQKQDVLPLQEVVGK